MSYENRGWLYQKYWEEKLSANEMGKLCGMNRKTIEIWMKKFAIKFRTKSEAGKIAQNRPETKNKISNTIKKLWANPEYRKKGSKANKINVNRLEFKKVHSKYMKELWTDLEYRKRINKALKIAMSHPGIKKRMSERSKKMWANPENVKKILRARKRMPSKPEEAFDKITPFCIRYIGNRAWWRKLNDGHNHNPDFKVTGQNKVIEIFGDYWHRGENPQELIDLYAQAGIDCLIFWENEIYNQPEVVMEKVNYFIGSA